MTVFFALINVIPGCEDTVSIELKNMSDIKWVYPLYGEYDIIVKFEAYNRDSAEKIIEKINAMEDVLDVKLLEGIKF